VAQYDTAPGGRWGEASLIEQAMDVMGYSRSSRLGEPIIGLGKDCWNGAARGHGDLRSQQQREIILRITKCDKILMGAAELRKRALDPERFVDSAGQHHERCAVEHHLAIDSRTPDRI
jgi:hypothetical protein